MATTKHEISGLSVWLQDAKNKNGTAQKLVVAINVVQKSRSKSWFGECGLVSLFKPMKLQGFRSFVFATTEALVGVIEDTLAFAANE